MSEDTMSLRERSQAVMRRIGLLDEPLETTQVMDSPKVVEPKEDTHIFGSDEKQRIRNAPKLLSSLLGIQGEADVIGQKYRLTPDSVDIVNSLQAGISEGGDAKLINDSDVITISKIASRDENGNPENLFVEVSGTNGVPVVCDIPVKDMYVVPHDAPMIQRIEAEKIQ